MQLMLFHANQQRKIEQIAANMLQKHCTATAPIHRQNRSRTCIECIRAGMRASHMAPVFTHVDSVPMYNNENDKMRQCVRASGFLLHTHRFNVSIRHAHQHFAYTNGT